VGYPRWLAINPSVGSKGDAYDNGKAERFIRTRLELWAYACPYADERQRTIALAPVLDSYNRFRAPRGRSFTLGTLQLCKRCPADPVEPCGFEHVFVCNSFV